MSWILGIIGLGASYCLIKYRQQLGDMIGEPSWAQKIGGIYNVMIISGIFVFFWSIAYMTGTMDVLFSPIFSMFQRKVI